MRGERKVEALIPGIILSRHTTAMRGIVPLEIAMPSPFPGMDPYLEDPAVWSGFHHAFLSAIQEQLAPQLRPNYFVRVEERVFVTDEADPAFRYFVPDVRVVRATHPHQRSTVPATHGAAVAELMPVGELVDPEIHEHRLEVLDRIDRSVVTVIELLSPTNKVSGAVGRNSFLQKRREVLVSPAHWMEIDLLRRGTRTANFAETTDAEYQLYLSRAANPRRGYVLPIFLRHRLPAIGIPLRHDHPDARVDLQSALDHVYDLCGYDMDFDYTRAPAEPLSEETAHWAKQLLAAKPAKSDPRDETPG